jgi:hypothetical protein
LSFPKSRVGVKGRYRRLVGGGVPSSPGLLSPGPVPPGNRGGGRGSSGGLRRWGTAARGWWMWKRWPQPGGDHNKGLSFAMLRSGCSVLGLVGGPSRLTGGPGRGPVAPNHSPGPALGPALWPGSSSPTLDTRARVPQKIRVPIIYLIIQRILPEDGRDTRNRGGVYQKKITLSLDNIGVTTILRP